jgi:hypothetical protein
MNTLTKAPYEFFPIFFNFSAELLSGETISSYTISCINTKNLLNTISTIVDSSEISGVKIKVMVKDGGIDEQHKLTAKITTSTGNIYEKDVLLVIAYDDGSEFEKQPREQFLILNDFKNELGTGETLWTKAVTATRLDDEADFTSQIITMSVFSGTRVVVGVQSGNDEEVYRIAIQVVTNGGSKFQKNIIMIVNEI